MAWHPPLLPEEKPISLEDIEARLLAQEHRPLAAWGNLLSKYGTFPKEDPRRKAILLSVIYCTLLSPSTIAAAGTIVGVATIALLVWQNRISQESNKLLQGQLSSQQEQITDQIQYRRRSDRLAALRDLHTDQKPGIRTEAFQNYLQSSSPSDNSFRPYGGALSLLPIRGMNLSECTISSVEGVAFIECNLHKAHISKLEERYFRACDLSEASITNPHFSGCCFDGIDFRKINYSIKFKSCWFINCKFEERDSTYGFTTFEDCLLVGSNLNQPASIIATSDYLGKNVILHWESSPVDQAVKTNLTKNPAVEIQAITSFSPKELFDQR